MFFRRTRPTVPSFEQELEQARRQGFTVESTAAGTRLAKDGCVAVIAADLRFVEKPAIEIAGQVARLLDRGYQKFFQTSDGRAHPALAPQLQALHDFDAELRHLFRLTSLYNESLGTVSDRYVYDRLAGRP